MKFDNKEIENAKITSPNESMYHIGSSLLHPSV